MENGSNEPKQDVVENNAEMNKVAKEIGLSGLVAAAMADAGMSVSNGTLRLAVILVDGTTYRREGFYVPNCSAENTFTLEDGVIKLYTGGEFIGSLYLVDVEVVSVIDQAAELILEVGQEFMGGTIDSFISTAAGIAIALRKGHCEDCGMESPMPEPSKELPLFHAEGGVPIFEGDSWFSVGLIDGSDDETETVKGLIHATDRVENFCPSVPSEFMVRFSTLALAKRRVLQMSLEDKGLDITDIHPKILDYMESIKNRIVIVFTKKDKKIKETSEKTEKLKNNYENFTISSKNNDGIFDVQKIIYNLL